MNTVALLDSAASIVYLLGQRGVLARRLHSPDEGAQWNAVLYPSGKRKALLMVDWIFHKSPPAYAFDLPLVMALTEQTKPAVAPVWLERFALAIRTRDAVMMLDLTRKNGWRLLPPSNSSRVKH